MQKRLFALLSITLISISSRSQDVGYRTIDAGAEYQYTKDGPVINLQLGFNAEEHHSVIIRGGYRKVSGQATAGHTDESGTGWGGSVGYRYHFSVIPKRFFIGARAELWNINVNWNTPEEKGTSRRLVLQPAIEAGYTFVINDYLFITPNVSASIQTTLQTKGEAVAYGTGFMPMAGLSLGWRF